MGEHNERRSVAGQILRVPVTPPYLGNLVLVNLLTTRAALGTDDGTAESPSEEAFPPAEIRIAGAVMPGVRPWSSPRRFAASIRLLRI